MSYNYLKSQYLIAGLTVNPESVLLLTDHFQTSGYSVGLNEPYAFSMSISNPPVGFYSVMIEVNKRLYMAIEQEQTVKRQHYEDTKSVIHLALQKIQDYEKDNGLKGLTASVNFRLSESLLTEAKTVITAS